MTVHVTPNAEELSISRSANLTQLVGADAATFIIRGKIVSMDGALVNGSGTSATELFAVTALWRGATFAVTN